MILVIDTQDQRAVTISLMQKGEVTCQQTEYNQFGSQIILPLISKMLKKQHLQWSDLAGVEVKTGPGSFTGLRVGTAIANSIGFALDIKVNGKKMETELLYD